MKSDIKDLWYGARAPWSEQEDNFREINQVHKANTQIYEKLYGMLGEKEKELIEEYQKGCEKEIFLSREASFIKGFCLGVRLIAEAMTE